MRQIVNVVDLQAFQSMLRLCAGRSGQLLNLSSLAGDVGVSHNTVKGWISVLEASYIVFRLPPIHRNLRKGLELDLIIEHGDRLSLIECKSGQTVATDFFASLDRTSEILGEQEDAPSKRVLLYGGTSKQTRGDTRVLGWRDVATQDWTDLGG